MSKVLSPSLPPPLSAVFPFGKAVKPKIRVIGGLVFLSLCFEKGKQREEGRDTEEGERRLIIAAGLF